MSHRASVTSSTGFSPYEVFFGQPMDRELLSHQTDSSSLQAYMRDIAPKLTILHDLATQNATESAVRHPKYRNVNAKPPSFKVADKVLFFDPTTKTGQNSKLKRRWTGLHLITEVLNNLNFKLQELETGRMIITCGFQTLYNKPFSARHRKET
jgi:hypothetical protein